MKVKYDNQFYTNAIYKTLPSDPKVPIRMINAGDSGYTQASHNLSKIITAYKPDIFFIGGDVAYDNNMPACAYTWDFFIREIYFVSQNHKFNLLHIYKGFAIYIYLTLYQFKALSTCYIKYDEYNLHIFYITL